jgi:hypothetical protein
VAEKAENQRKTREKSKVAENGVFWLDFCAKKMSVHTPLGMSFLQKKKALTNDAPTLKVNTDIIYISFLKEIIGRNASKVMQRKQ